MWECKIKQQSWLLCLTSISNLYENHVLQQAGPICKGHYAETTECFSNFPRHTHEGVHTYYKKHKQ